EVAHDLRLGKARQADLALAGEAAKPVVDFRRLGQVDAAASGRALLEDQRLFMLQAAMAGVSGECRRGGGGFRLRRAALTVKHGRVPRPAPWSGWPHRHRCWFRW